VINHLNKKNSKPNRVVVLGAGGFVSSKVSKKLVGKKISVLNLTRKDLDLTKNESVKKLIKIINNEDTLFFAAAKAPVKNHEMFLQNLLMCKTVVEAISEKPVNHLVYLSSDAVYSDSKELISENSETKPNSLHGLMHLTREIMLNIPSNKFFCIVRPTLIYGDNDPHNSYGPNKFFRSAKKNEDIELFGKGEELRDHVWIEDVAEIVCRLIINKSVGKINLATGSVISFSQIAREIIKLTKSSSVIKSIKRNGPMPHNGYRAFNIGCCKKFFSDFRYNFLTEGIKKINLN